MGQASAADACLVPVGAAVRAVEGKTKLEVVLSSNQAEKFKEALTKDFDSMHLLNWLL